LLLVFMWVLTTLVTVPPAFVLHGSMTTHLGSSLEADAAADGVNFSWMQEFQSASGPLARTLRPEVIGFAATVDNTSALAEASIRSAIVAAAAGIYVVLVWFTSAGVITRLAARHRIEARGFAAACGAFAGRLLRLGAAAAVVYTVLFGAVHQALLEDLFDTVTADMTVERTAFAVRLVLYAVFFLLLGVVNLIFDFARVRLIAENRYSILSSIAAAVAFVGRRPRLAIGVYLLNVASYGVVVAAYAALAPGAGSAGWTMWLAFAVGQAYVIARLAVKLAFWSSELVAVQMPVGS
jgi:hypothetical protein